MFYLPHIDKQEVIELSVKLVITFNLPGNEMVSLMVSLIDCKHYGMSRLKEN